MTLWELHKGGTANISHLCEHLDDSVSTRLVEMGFETDQYIKCLRRSIFSGPLVIQIGDCVYSLEQALAEQIFISTSNNN
ncbi:MAG: ferrous iron transport protein A [Psychrosphaera sp.]|jgi:ferrous iron transport protein A|uniref:FeoA family protein n=1 Tax=Psychrosphaera aquimarina TaxID=2044854 RepID=A0ABU3QYH8_9GAMM|nr:MULTISPECIES: FeoA family protein [Psychrosphaera]MBU2918313.1 ferrous iron transport protein A [Psychrosphaera sp. F3M07]MDU0112334.1 FeoA family protein [Psychrosphaera aquimarina]